jgi:hypothetical protein
MGAPFPMEVESLLQFVILDNRLRRLDGLPAALALALVDAAQTVGEADERGAAVEQGGIILRDGAPTQAEESPRIRIKRHLTNPQSGAHDQPPKPPRKPRT